MTTNPFYNALFAISYIMVLVTAIFHGSNILKDVVEESIFLPMGVLATLVLSVALMGYLFFLQPVQMFLEGQKHEAVELFTKTLGAFAIITGIILAVAFTV